MRIAILGVLFFVAVHVQAEVFVQPSSPCLPYRVGAKTPRLTTPMWAGEGGVEAVVILSIDDMRDTAKYEAFLRPLLDRLKQIDGRAPVSIFTNSIEPDDPQLQSWLKEGLSLEVHTVDHPCPLLRDGDFPKAKSTYDRCVDMMDAIPGNKTVAFRMPCCDSLNTPSPRFWTEVFEKSTSSGNFLQIDSSVFNVFTADDSELPKSLVTNEKGESRFRHYLPFPSFVNTIENYPYPYVVGDRCWEFPCVVPSDWEAQNIQEPNNPDTVRDLKLALDATVIKRGVMPIVFHPHGWIRNDQLVEFVDYAARRYGGKVKFLTFAEALTRLNRYLMDSKPLRSEDGRANSGMQLVDLNQDGFLDTLQTGDRQIHARVWNREQRRFIADRLDVKAEFVSFFHRDGKLGMLVAMETGWRAYLRGRSVWQEVPVSLENTPRSNPSVPNDLLDVRWRDLDADGTCELLLTNEQETWVYEWEQDLLRPMAVPLPSGPLVTRDRSDSGVRFVDLNSDQRLDLVLANGAHYGVWLLDDSTKGWKKVRSGIASEKDAIPNIVRRDGTNNGAWFHSDHLWVQNEYTNRLPDLVQRATFEELIDDAPFGKAKDLSASLKTFSMLDGAKLEVVAAEPQVQDPVAFDWAADGTLWVAEMGDYPNGKAWHGPGDQKGVPGGKIKLLQDLDDDGRYETSHVFLDGLNTPTGVKAWRNGVLITAAPDVFYAEDTDGDYKADVKRVLYTGLREGNQQHRANGLRWSLDHSLHMANGDSGGVLRSVETNVQVDIRGRDVRIEPDTGAIELTSGQTQFGRSRDNQGNWFGGNNSHPAWHYVLEDVYMRRNPHIKPPSARFEFAEIPGAAPVFPTSRTVERFNDFDRANRFTSACSPEPARVDGQSAIYVCEPVHNLVHRAQLALDGVTFVSRRETPLVEREFLASSDGWFRPVMVRQGPDGGIWIADMYRMVIEHPEWIPMHWQNRIDHLSGNDRGRIYRVRLPGASDNAAWRNIRNASLKELVQRIDTPNGVVRDLIQQEIFERDDKACVPALLSILATCQHPNAKIPVLYLLEHFQSLPSKVLVEALNKADLDRNVVRIVEKRLRENPHDKKLREAFLGLFETASRIDRLPSSTVVQCAFTLGEISDARVGASLARLATKYARNRFVVAAIASSLTKENLKAVTASLLNSAQSEKPANLLEYVVASAIGFDDVDSLGEVIAWQRDAERKNWGLCGAVWEGTRQKSAQLPASARSALKEICQQARTVVEGEEYGIDEKSAAMRLFGYEEEFRQAEFATAVSLLSPSNATPLQLAAIEVLRRASDDTQLGFLLDQWRTFTPTLRDAVLDLAYTRSEWLAEVLDGMEAGDILPVQIGVTHRRRLLEHADSQIRLRAESFFSDVAGDRATIVSQFAGKVNGLASGGGGVEVFKTHCSACHRLEDVGNAVGPDLSALSDKSMPAMLAAVFDPNRAVESKYLGYSILTDEGVLHDGLLLEETSTAMTLAKADGKREVLLRHQIDEIVATGKSLMPEGLEQVIRPQQFVDLVAYLRSVSVPRKSFPGNEPRVAPVRNDGSIRLFAMHAEIFGPSLVFEGKHRNLGFWNHLHDHARWKIEAAQADEFELRIEYACPPQPGRNRYQILVDGQRLSGTVEPTSSWDEYRTVKVGNIRLPDEATQLSIRADGPISGYLMDLRTIYLYPVD